MNCLVKYPEPRQLLRFPINLAEATEEQKAGIQLLRSDLRASPTFLLLLSINRRIIGMQNGAEDSALWKVNLFI
jgi:hypothetical protein